MREENDMNAIQQFTKRHFLLSLALGMCGFAMAAQQSGAALRGQVLDETGAVIVSAKVTLTDAQGNQRHCETNAEGSYAFSGLPQGKYFLRAEAPGFAQFDSPAIAISTTYRETLNIKLRVMIEGEKVTVEESKSLTTAPDSN